MGWQRTWIGIFVLPTTLRAAPEPLEALTTLTTAPRAATRPEPPIQAPRRLGSPPDITPANEATLAPQDAEKAPLFALTALPRRWAFATEVQVALLRPGGHIASAWAGALSASYRTHQFAWGLSLAANFWNSPTLEQDRSEVIVVLNPGLSAEYRFADDFARTAIGLGPSVVLVPPSTDTTPGAVGAFVDVRPLGLRWEVATNWILGLDPLGVALLVPDLSGIPLAELQYKTTLRLEFLP